MNDMNLSAFSDQKQWTDYLRALIIAGIAMFFFFLVLSYFVLSVSSIAHDHNKFVHADDLLGMGEVIGLVTVAIAVPLRLKASTNEHERIFGQLIKDNDWKHKPTYRPETLASILLGAGNYSVLYSFEGKDHGHPFNCSLFEFAADTSEAAAYRRMTCLNIKIPKSFPTVVIDNKQNDLDHGHRSNLPERIPNGVTLSLEGNFNDYYHVSTTKGSERESTEVMAPDLMAVIEDMAGSKIDIEINGKDLFLMHENDFYTEQSLKDLFDLANQITDKLKRLSKTWMASSKTEAKSIALTARHTRNKLIKKPMEVHLAAVALELGLVIALILIGIGSR